MRITINVPGDDTMSSKTVDYVRLVANQLHAGYLSGHVDAETHWDVDRSES